MKFYLEKPSLKRKSEVLELIEEYKKFHSSLDGLGSLKRYLEDYDAWIKNVKKEEKNRLINDIVPTNNYLLIRKKDDKIIGFINIRKKVNKELKKYGGNIGYSIRPTERGKGYNKINLYLGLIECQKYGIKKIFIAADKENIASWKTIEALGGIQNREYYDNIFFHCTIKNYIIDVDKSIEKYRETYKKI